MRSFLTWNVKNAFDMANYVAIGLRSIIFLIIIRQALIKCAINTKVYFIVVVLITNIPGLNIKIVDRL